MSDKSGTRLSAFVLDADGNRLSEVQLTAQATGIAAMRQNLIVTDARGLLRYATADIVPDTTAEVQCTLITPLLQSLDLEGGSPWLRVDSSATLPEGTTLEISYAATDDPEVRDRLKAITEDVRLPSSQRIQKLLSEPDLWSSKTIFHGSDREPEVPDAPRSAPLFDVRGRYLWVCVTLTAARGARLPAVTELAVSYPGRSLMENLPTPYRRAAAQPGDFLRSLVGVLEATTQDLDTRIAALGSHIHPATAAGPWMDYVAGWLGLPWDDALTDEQKRAILLHASDLAKRRGTRAGLETLLECLLPGSPRRFRVTDAIVDFGYAVVGGDRCAGSALPAMLGGFTRWHAELDSTTVLGYTRLPCTAQVDGGTQGLVRKIRIEVAAGAKKREASEPWLLTLITEMVPLTVSVALRWVSAQALRTDRLDDTLVLEAPPSPHLGSDAVIGLARLPEQRRTRLAGSGPAVGTRLR
jgi:phage tail-like protein